MKNKKLKELNTYELNEVIVLVKKILKILFPFIIIPFSIL